jgi:hypothetical protein
VSDNGTDVSTLYTQTGATFDITVASTARRPTSSTTRPAPAYALKAATT